MLTLTTKVNNVTYLKDFCGATASITEHRDGTATLAWHEMGKRVTKKYTNAKNALRAWKRMCD